jgi:streptogramin lyase
VTLYAAGSSGYGSAPKTLVTTTSDSNGSFGIAFIPESGCPAGNLNDQTYIVATGGNAGGGSNSAIGLMALTGPCNSLTSSTFVVVNELTTAAAQWSLAQFIDSTGIKVGTSATNALGLNNSTASAQSNLVVSYLQSGGTTSNTGVPASFLPWSSSSSTCTSTQNCDGLQRLDTMANILAACDTSSGPSSSPCGTLFTATGVSSTATMLSAAHAIVTDPASQVSTIYGVQQTPSTSAPYQPALSAAPNDLTLPLNFNPTGANFSAPRTIAIDGGGAAWIANFKGNSVTKLTSSGALAGNFTSGSPRLPYGVAIDNSGNAWVANFFGGNDLAGSVIEFNNSGSTATAFNNSNTSPGDVFDDPTDIAFDSTGNLWISNTQTGGFGSPAELIAGCTSGSCTGINFNGITLQGPIGVAIDASNNIWMENTTGSYAVVELSSCTNSGCTVSTLSPIGASLNSPVRPAIDAAGNVWVANQAGVNSGVSKLAAGCTTFSCTGNDFNPAGANIDKPSSVAIDGAGNVWTANQGTSQSVTELTNAGALVGNFAPTGASFSSPSSIAIDGSGNVWVSNCGSANCNSAGVGGVSELVGAAPPVLTPKVACLTKATPSTVCTP